MEETAVLNEVEVSSTANVGTPVISVSFFPFLLGFFWFFSFCLNINVSWLQILFHALLIYDVMFLLRARVVVRGEGGGFLF